MPDEALEHMAGALADFEPLEGIPQQLYQQLLDELEARVTGWAASGYVEFDLSDIAIDAVPRQVGLLFRILHASKDARAHLTPPEDWFILDSAVEFLFGCTRAIGSFYFPAYQN
jgi:hypothetical protein